MRKTKLKRLIFKKGVNRIVFPAFLPSGKFDFRQEAEKQINKIRSRYIPRKHIGWNYIANFQSGLAEVIIEKNYLGRLYGFPVYINK